MATGYHGPSYVKYAGDHSDAELAACCDADESKAITFRDRFGFARHYTDYSAMLEAERPDVVCLVVPEPLTCELSCRILEMGYPLMMEKPPGRTVKEIDRMITAAGDTASRVAFNRRYTPLVQHLKRLLAQRFAPADIQHVRCDFVRVGRADADFSLTAIHGIDTTRFLAGADYAHVRFHYQDLPGLGPTATNVFMDCTFSSGATAHVAFCPLAGVVVERATVHAHNNTFFLNIPVWSAFDSPGRLQHLRKNHLELDVTGADLDDDHREFVLSGFYAENASFFDAVRTGQRPSGGLKDARQSVEIAQCIRERRNEYST
jgi:predicted dehydrogenase